MISGLVTAVFMFFIYYQGFRSIAAGFFIGTGVYLSIVFYKRKIEKYYLRKINLFLLLLLNAIVQVVIILVIAMFFVGIFYLDGHFEVYFGKDSVLQYNAYFVGLLFGVILSIIFSFLTIIDTLIGKNTTLKLFLGRYRKPVEEDRIFMFLDINSSTAIAEKIGHEKFLSLLNDFFFDIVEAVDKTRGEIYKYVGDEVIVTWRTQRGLRDARCIRCFFMIEEIMQRKQGIYQQRYGLVPEFKAGLHGGIAVTGELGYTRREVAYVGDVLNTTARIVGECNNYGERLLISGELLRRLELPAYFQPVEVGTVKLRGKEKEQKLFAIQPVR